MKFRTTDYHYDHTGKLVEGSTAPIRPKLRPLAQDFYTVDNKFFKKNYLRWYSIGRDFRGNLIALFLSTQCFCWVFGLDQWWENRIYRWQDRGMVPPVYSEGREAYDDHLIAIGKNPYSNYDAAKDYSAP